MSDTDQYYKNIVQWNYTEGTLNKTLSIEDEKTIFFPIDLYWDVRYWDIILKTFQVRNISLFP